MFEELIAGVYKKLDARIVELSPKSGDGGVDVWAVYELPGLGDVTMMDQVKLYGPDQTIDPGDVHRIFGGGNRGQEFSKAVLSTTGRIPPVVRRETAVYGERVELRDAKTLEKVFADVLANAENRDNDR